MIAKSTIKDAPIATGINMKLIPLAPRIAIIGFAPAGGWTVFVAIIKKMANPTANPKLTNEESSIQKTNTPAKADNICPNNIFFGCAKGLSWTAITKTILAPNGGISHKLVSSKELRKASMEMHINAPRAERILFFIKENYLERYHIQNRHPANVFYHLV